MSETIVVLTEEPLNDADLRNLELLATEGTEFSVLIPEDTKRNLVLDFLDNLSLLDVAQAFRELLHGQPSPDEAKTEAEEAKRLSVQALQGRGLRGTVEIVDDDGVSALVEYVERHPADRAVVITTPHAVADTFHTDWANRAQDKLGIPVLHLYSGSGYIGDS
ncbi:hypothetical protein [Arthrobacter crystallopoietes]|uniref:hypothetical protein n=1 Tax=Crystallibacter crystallopoietes TaxID=37928 RepID=UPI0011112913|nr:hypothetical protein [Arthrobacter crystallopoietes]QTG79985.1 hypothetical protein J5251_13940 [Arthrobacter crystallopoietes]